MKDLFEALPPATIQERFERFDREHPEVYVEFKKIAVRLLEAGRAHYSADAIMHVVRFHRDVNPEHDEGFKVNDHFVCRYARKLMADDQRFAEFFETRTIRTE